MLSKNASSNLWQSLLYWRCLSEFGFIRHALWTTVLCSCILSLLFQISMNSFDVQDAKWFIDAVHCLWTQWLHLTCLIVLHTLNQIRCKRRHIYAHLPCGHRVLGRVVSPVHIVPLAKLAPCSHHLLQCTDTNCVLWPRPLQSLPASWFLILRPVTCSMQSVVVSGQPKCGGTPYTTHASTWC